MEIAAQPPGETEVQLPPVRSSQMVGSSAMGWPEG